MISAVNRVWKTEKKKDTSDLEIDEFEDLENG
jgi:hypothetical protein